MDGQQTHIARMKELATVANGRAEATRRAMMVAEHKAEDATEQAKVADKAVTEAGDKAFDTQKVTENLVNWARANVGSGHTWQGSRVNGVAVGSRVAGAVGRGRRRRRNSKKVKKSKRKKTKRKNKKGKKTTRRRR